MKNYYFKNNNNLKFIDSKTSNFFVARLVTFRPLNTLGPANTWLETPQNVGLGTWNGFAEIVVYRP